MGQGWAPEDGDPMSNMSLRAAPRGLEGLNAAGEWPLHLGVSFKVEVNLSGR